MGYTDRDKKNEYARNWMRQRRDEYFKDKSCGKCGNRDQLELDHKDPATKVHHAIWSWSAVRRSAELAKCQVLCFRCHREKSNKELQQKEHGVTKYRNGCRCDICKTAQRIKMQKYRKKQ